MFNLHPERQQFMSQPKPIKRSKELAPLSREHHDGLLLCWKIRTGFARQIEEERIVNYVQHFYNTDLKPHFQKEEDYLFVLLPATDSLRTEAVGQHRELEGLIGLMNNGLAHIALSNFADLLERHIRFEERDLFPHFESVTDTLKLQAVSEQIDSKEKQCEMDWNDKFWIK